MTLPVEQVNQVDGYRLKLPLGISLAGVADDLEGLLRGGGTSVVHLRARYLPSANRSPVEASLPFIAVGDEMKKKTVKLPSGKLATLVELNFDAALHPGMQNLSQKELFIPIGPEDGDFIALSAEGTPEAMQSADETITAIFASCQSLRKAAPEALVK